MSTTALEPTDPLPATSEDVTRSRATGLRLRFRDILTRVPAAVWAVTALHVCLMLAYTLFLPIYRAPDEVLHIDLVLAVRDEPLTWPGPGERMVADRIHESIVYLDFDGARERALSSGEASLRADRPSFTELGTGEQRDWFNQLVQHPPFYYLLSAGWLWIAPGIEDQAFDVVAWYLRLLNVLMLAPLPLLAHAAARRLAGPGPVATSAAVLVLAVPQLTHMGAVVNNDNALTLVSAVLTVICVFVARGDRSLRTASWAGGLVAAGMLIKAFAIVLPLWIALAYALGWRRRGGRVPWKPVLLAGVLAAVVSGWWWVANYLRFGTFQPDGVELYPPVPGFTPDPSFYWFERFIPYILTRWWGSYGWLNVPLQWQVVVVAACLLTLALALAATVRLRGTAPTRVDAALLMVPTVTLLVLVAILAWDNYATSSIDAGIQGRYLFPGLTALLVAAALGLGAGLRRWARRLPLALLAGAATIHVAGLTKMLPRFWGVGDGDPIEVLRAVYVWAPPPGRIVAAIALGTGPAILLTLALLVRDGGRADTVPLPAGPSAGTPGGLRSWTAEDQSGTTAGSGAGAA